MAANSYSGSECAAVSCEIRRKGQICVFCRFLGSKSPKCIEAVNV